MIRVNDLGIEDCLGDVANVLAGLPNKQINEWLDVLEERVAAAVAARRPVGQTDSHGFDKEPAYPPFVRRGQDCPECGYSE